MADGKVIIDTQLNNKGFIKGLKGMESEVSGLQATVNKLGATIASAFAVGTLVNFGKECVELGSDVSEVQNVVDVAFGDMADQVESFADRAIQNFGMSRLAAKKTASTYMAMAKGMGVADESAAEMSITLAGLTGDIASFYNISQELADIKLKSVFTGETETLKDLGVVMTQDNLKAYALAQGITKSYEAMSQSEKVALRYGFVLDALSLAQGDFARTSDSWANQTRILSMQWQEFMGIVGQTLITVLTPVVRTLNSIVSGLISVANSFNAVITSIFGGAGNQIQQTASASAEVGSAIGGAVENQEALTGAVKDTNKALKGSLAGFDEINRLAGESASGGGGATSGTTGSGSTFEIIPVDKEELSGTLGWIESALLRLQETVSRLNFDNLSSAFSGLKDALAGLGEDAFSALAWAYTKLAQWTVEDAIPAFLDTLSAGAEFLSAALVRLQPLAEWLWSEFLAPLASWTGELFVAALGEITDLLRDLADLLSGETTFGDFITNLSPAQTALFGIAAALLTIEAIVAGKALLDGLTSITKFFKDVIALNAVGTIGKLGEVFLLVSQGAGTLSEAMKLVFGPKSIIAGVAAIVGGAVLAITNFASMLENRFSWANEALMLLGIAITAVGAIILGAPALVTGVVAGIVAAIATAVVVIKENWEDIKRAFSTAWNFIKTEFLVKWNAIKVVINGWKSYFQGVWKDIKGVFSDAWNAFTNIGKNIVEGIKNGILGAWSSFTSWVSGKIGGLVSGATGSFGSSARGSGFSDYSLSAANLSIPHLATGSVVPPNREFMAILGDNKTETEIVSPLSTMKQAFVEAMQESGGFGGGNYKFEIYINGRKMAVEMVKEVNRMTQEAGKPVLMF